MRFKTRGPITDPDEFPYITRPADAELEGYVKQLEYVALIGARLSGKTSMLLRLWKNLRKLPRYVLCYANLSLYRTFDLPQWYSTFYNELILSSGNLLPASENPVENAISFREAMADAMEDRLSNRIVIVMLDEVETVPLDLRTSFFATLREMHETRGFQNPQFRHLTFVLTGSYIPDELILDQAISPFRVAEKVYIEDAADVTPLVKILDKPERPISADVPACIQEWTEGDVYLTQVICNRLNVSYADRLITPNAVNQVIEKYLYDDDAFTTLETRLKARPHTLRIVHDVVTQATTVRFTRTNHDIVHGWLLGCIKPNEYGNSVIRNGVFENTLRDMMRRVTIPSAERTPFTPSHETPQSPQPVRGRYKLESLLKRGAMNHIYRARDLNSGQNVIIKQLLASKNGDVVAWRRFQREGEALRRLNHANIVQLYETFRSGDFNYIVMEYVDGGTVELLLNREGRQPIKRTLEIVTGVADALRLAHQHQIIHRDIKPSNILLTASFVPKLADFGVARFIAETDKLTATHAIVGTPAYIAPESYQNGTVAPTEDIWALGVTMYEMLTGTLPFSGRTFDHIRYAIQNDPIPNVRTVRADVPEALANLLANLLNRNPRERLPDGEALYQALLRIRL